VWFAEAASDDGSLTGRGKPLLRGVVCGLMTTAGGIGHTLPYLIPNFRTATAIAVVIVTIELLLISWIRIRYMDTPFLRAAFQVIVGGALVFLVGIWIGSSYTSPIGRQFKLARRREPTTTLRWHHKTSRTRHGSEMLTVEREI